ncbi:MAG: hypothetical protein RLN94_15105 [Roseovarius sp.]|uniref:hypothetical protein n=1 Tax=Roseovarius sp. TaxID=1486281 RepID=UPI0032EBE93E
MTARRHRGCRAPQPENGDIPLASARLDRSERDCLALARRFFQLLANPDADDRQNAIERVAGSFGADHGLAVAWAMSDLLREIRQSRRSTFYFSNPDCPGCARLITEHERRLVAALAALRRGRRSAAHVEVMLLCEGNPDETVLDGLARLADLLPPPDRHKRKTRAWTGH